MLDKDTLTIVVNCLVFSKLYYCSNVLSNTTESNLDKVQKVQNFACLIISGVKKFEHITPVLRAMQWLPIRQQLYYNNAVIAFKCMAGCRPEHLMDQFIKLDFPCPYCFLQQVLLRSLRVYVLKLILFSISVKSGISLLVFKVMRSWRAVVC